MAARLALVLIPLAMGIRPAAAESGDLTEQARLLMSSPDVRLTAIYELPTRPDVLENILREPIFLMRLWEAYRFSPRYRARLVNDDGIHVDDPTGISGDIFLAERLGSRRVYVACGALNHRLVPPFRGKLAVVLASVPGESAVNAHIDVYLRMDNRIIGFLARSLYPLVRSLMQHRLSSNASDMGTILHDLAEAPKDTAGRLDKDDAAALLEVLSGK